MTGVKCYSRVYSSNDTETNGCCDNINISNIVQNLIWNQTHEIMLSNKAATNAQLDTVSNKCFL